MERLSWRPATVVAVRQETATARTLTLEVEGWAGHRPGQHIDLRLTAPDGYTAVRPYSIATPSDGSRFDLTVGLSERGEVSPYLVSGAAVGTGMEVRGPLGGWFVWDQADRRPVQLVGGGVGVAPLMAMLRARERLTERHPMRLLYSTQSPATLLYAEELARWPRAPEVTVVYSRQSPVARPAGRLDVPDIVAYGLPPRAGIRCYVCGSTGFVEAGIGHLIAAGFADSDIRAERFGP